MAKSFMPNGSVTASRFVKLDATQTGGYVLQCGAGDIITGVAQQGTQEAPLVGLDSAFAGTQEQNEILVYTPPDTCTLEIGAAVSLGDFLKSDASGRGITAGTDGDWYGARAMQSGTAAGQLIRVEVIIGSRGA
ncbi:MAG: hypothetical protein KGL39_29680 [Patescibacteria group bacterium]|nr:hypothetical protein [Patescibacteria group bacterium]